MPISEIERRKAEDSLRAYCEAKTNPAVRDQLAIVYRIEGNYAYVSEQRPDWRDPSINRVYDVAKMRFMVKDREWVLFWRDRNLRWHEFELCRRSSDVSDLLEVIDREPIFYG